MEEGSNPILEAAVTMLQDFYSVGATGFDVTWTNLEGEKQRFRRAVPSDTLIAGLPVALQVAESRRHNLIVRPNASRVLFQLDDLDADRLARVRPFAFLALQTSPGNHQAWVALSMPADDDFGRRLRKGTGADPTASGATRVAGSLNFKTRYAPDFPRVAIEHENRGRAVTPSALEAAGLVSSPEMRRAPANPAWRSSYRPMTRKWPDYGKCLDGAPANHAGSGPDVSRADFTFAMIASDWGWSIEDIASRLCEASVKAQENGPRYALMTATKAADASARRNGGSWKPAQVP